MTTFNTLLDEALESWAYARSGVIEELKNIPDKDMGFQPAAGARSVLEIAQHIIESGMMMAGELTRPEGDFRRQSYEGFLHEHARGVSGKRTRPQLLALLKMSHTDGEKRFRKAGEIQMMQLINRFDGEKGTRMAWMFHGIAHEDYHRGQLALCARLLGRVPAQTKRIHGK